MNYILPSLFALIIVWSCTSKSQQSDNSISPTGADTLSFAIPTVTETRKDELPKRDEGSVEPVTADSSAYIGELYAFPATGDYYIYLPFPGDFQQLSRITDSLVYEDDEIRRRRIPESAANRYFNLVGLETISVYTRAGYAGDARFVRVEQFDDVIDGSFIAIFKPTDSSAFAADVAYCTSKELTTPEHPFTPWETAIDSAHIPTLLKLINRHAADVWHTVNAKSRSVTYWAISFSNECFLLETGPEGSVIRKHITDDYYIREIIPTHVRVNNRPVLLLFMGVNETDMTWTSVGIFNGVEYALVEGNRLKGWALP